MQTQTAPRVLVVPGAAVRSYVGPAVRELRDRGFDAELLAAPGSPGSPADLVEYGTALADRLRAEDAMVELLIGLSVGAQAAAVAAAASVTERGEGDVVAAAPQVRRVLLVGPTVDPAVRSTPRLLARWLAGGRVEGSGLLREQAPEWRRAGPRQLVELVRSACRVAIEDVLPGIAVPVDVVHAERDLITSHEYAAALAAQAGGRFVIVPGGTHSWPHDDGPRFADLITETVAGVRR